MEKSSEQVMFCTPPVKADKKKTGLVDHQNQTSNQYSIFRKHSIEETEAAHDLLSLSQSLPPLPAPCVVTILQQNGDSSNRCIISSAAVMQEISNSFNSRSNITVNEISKIVQNEIEARSSYFQFENSSNIYDNNTENCSPLTLPSFEHSSDIEIEVSPVSESASQSININNSRLSHSDLWNADLSKIKKEKNLIVDGRTKNRKYDQNDTTKARKTKGGVYKCSECGKQYATSSNLSRHKQTHRSLDSQSAKKCSTCGKAYVSMPALAMHLLTHKLNHSCGICGKLFSRPWLLQGHLRSHTGEKPYICNHCNKSFADRSNLRAHMQTHSSDKNYKCGRCNKTFALKSYLNKHLESACLRDKDNNKCTMSSQQASENESGIAEFFCYKVRNSLHGSDDEEDIIVT